MEYCGVEVRKSRRKNGKKVEKWEKQNENEEESEMKFCGEKGR